MILSKRQLGIVICSLLCTILYAGAEEAVYHTDAEGFVRDWILGNPYPSYVTAAGKSLGYDADALKHLGGEANYAPFVGFEENTLFKVNRHDNIAVDAKNEWGYVADKTFVSKWQERHGTASPVISFENPVKHNIIGYAACYVISNRDREVRIRVGSADDFKLYVNHHLVGGKRSSREIHKDTDMFLVKLDRGVNLILLKIVEHGSGHHFSLSIRNPDETTCSDLEITLENPAAKILSQYKTLKRIDGFANGFFGQIDVEPENPLTPGKISVTFRLGSVAACSATAKFFITDSNGQKLLDSKANLKFNAGKLVIIQKQITFESSGALNFGVELDGKSGQAAIGRQMMVVSSEQLAKELAELEAACGKAQAEIDGLTKQLQERQSKWQAAKSEIASQYKAIEKSYEERRQLLKDLAGAEGLSVDEKFAGLDESQRGRMILNGDSWEIAPAVFKGRRIIGPAGGYMLDFDSTTVPASGWSKISVPFICIKGDYWGMNYHFPVRCKNENGPSTTLQPFGGDYKYNETRLSNGIWHKLIFDLPEGWEKQNLMLTLRNTQAWAKVFLNGEYCGEDSGFVGDYKINLKNAKKGKNELVIFLGSGRTRFHESTPCDDRWYPFWGIRGDVILESLPKEVAIDDAWVETSVRNAEIKAHLWIKNDSTTPRKISIDNYCVLDGKIKKRLATRQETVKPGATSEITVSAPWTDAELWGIGGEYGRPTLYNLVTEIREDGKLIDCKTTRFGFREFWVEGCHFYLNGKRIFLQGDLGAHFCSNRNQMYVILPELRKYGINTIRNHDAELSAEELPTVCDELGMLVIVQNYPFVDPFPLARKDGCPVGYASLERLLASPIHKINVDAYTRWVKMMRNHPSVVIYSMDNEMFLQSWEQSKKKPYAMRNDQAGAWYGRFVKKLDPTRVITRDGDQGTWGAPLGCWSENPPCETANYHYPETNISQSIKNWETTYGGRPVVFGETLYCSYASLNDWCGPQPQVVAKKADYVREIVGKYRECEIPGAIFMGLSSDGFVELGPKGNYPWKNATKEELKTHPYAPIPWPCQSGQGRKEEFAFVASCYGYLVINWFDQKYPTATPNPVNAAYKDTLLPMPQLNTSRSPEVLVKVTRNGNAAANKNVSVRPIGPIASAVQIVPTDKQGKAWFVLPKAGKYKVECEGSIKEIDAVGTDVYPTRAGFGFLKTLNMEIE